MGKRKLLEVDVVIIGGGPAGCTIARELSLRGKKVILIEKGRADDRLLGNGLGVLLRLEKGFHLPLPVKRTAEGYPVIQASCLGGGTLIYAGSAFEPDVGYWRRYGIELPPDLIEEAKRECWVNLPPEEFIGPGTRRIWDAARELGIPFERLHRHIDFSRCRPGCDYCLNGCRRDAKWTARVFADQAIAHGAIVLTGTEAEKIIEHGGTAQGVWVRNRGGERYEIRAGAVVLSAGGIHSARLLKRLGMDQAGEGFTGDPTFFTFGFAKEGTGNAHEHPMAVGWHDEGRKVIFCAMLSPYLSWHLQFIQDELLASLTRLHRFRKALGIFAKVSDEGRGRVTAKGRLSKTFTPGDLNRFEYARRVSREILIRAGCDPGDIHHSGFILGHPSGTVRVGQLLDADLETPINNLYCCDAGVMPEAPGRPPTLTIIVMAKRLARRLAEIL